MAIVTIIIILITVALFVAAIFTKGLTHDIFLESGVLLISIKIILLSYRNNTIVKNIQKQLDNMNSFLLLINKKTHNSSKASDVEEEIESYKMAIRINPDDLEAHFNLGNNYQKSGMYKEAIEAFKQAIRIDPDYAEAHYNLGNVYVLSNDKGSAIEQYKILKSLDPERANKLYNEIHK